MQMCEHASWLHAQRSVQWVNHPHLGESPQPTHSPTHRSLGDVTEKRAGLQFMTLNDVTSMLNHSQITIWKNDIEGFEYELIGGALRVTVLCSRCSTDLLNVCCVPWLQVPAPLAQAGCFAAQFAQA